MTSWLVGVMVAVMTNPKVEALLGKLIGDAVNTAVADLSTEVNKMETRLVESLEALPGVILGDATKDVQILLHDITGTKDEIASAVKGDLSPLFDPKGFAQAIVEQMLGQGGQKPPWWPF